MTRALRRHHAERVKGAHARFWRDVLHTKPGRPASERHPCDCGKARCKLCHHDKIFDKPRARDLRQGAE